MRYLPPIRKERILPSAKYLYTVFLPMRRIFCISSGRRMSPYSLMKVDMLFSRILSSPFLLRLSTNECLPYYMIPNVIIKHNIYLQYMCLIISAMCFFTPYICVMMFTYYMLGIKKNKNNLLEPRD